MSDLTSILLGGSATLVGTSAIHLFVVPIAQTRTRRRERWEKDVLELKALLEEELPRSLEGLMRASYAVRVGREKLVDPDEFEAALREYLLKADREKREASKVVGQQVARASILQDRLSWMHRDAVQWMRLFLMWVLVHTTVCELETDEMCDPAHIESLDLAKKWQDLDSRRRTYLEAIKKIAETMEPPPRPPLRTRSWNGLKKRWDAVCGACQDF